MNLTYIVLGEVVAIAMIIAIGIWILRSEGYRVRRK